MVMPFVRSVSRCVLASALVGFIASSAFAGGPVKVAFWNMMSGKGVDALPGHNAPFIDTPNCTDPTQPLNAWGVGATQAQLNTIKNDSAVIAMGVAEAWTSVCASHEAIREYLGWAATTGEQNGVGLIAKYGFAGPAQWQQLDTSLNTSPNDTAWVVRAPVCLNAACSQSMPVYTGHWYGTGSSWQTSYDRQAQQTATFLTSTSNGLPHVLVGDLNTFEGSAPVCSQSPNNTSLGYLRSAGYLDAWLTIHGAAEGYTGMADRAGCGVPEGYTWKRIDYAWTPASYQPIDIERWAMTTPGDASPSDHYAIVVTLPYPGTPVTPPPPPPTPPTSTYWTSLVNATANGAILQKTSGCGTCFDAGAIGTQTIGAGQSIGFSVVGGQRLFAGLSSDLSSSTSYVIDYAFSFWPNGTFEIREKNLYRTDGTYAPTDTFAVAVAGTVAQYYQNGALVYTSQTPVTGPLVFDTSLASIGATVQNLGSGSTGVPPPAPSSPTDVVWTLLVKATATGSTLTKTGTCSTCFDAGAISQQPITGDATFSFSVGAGQRLFAGLGHDMTSNPGFMIDYAFSFWPNATFEIRENNIYKAEGVSAPGDVFSVTVVSGVVNYYRNGTLVYTSKTPVSGPLVADTSLSTTGATVSAATIK